MVLSPCKGCNDRHFACHDKCDKYKQYRIEWKKLKKELRKTAGDVATAGKYNG